MKNRVNIILIKRIKELKKNTRQLFCHLVQDKEKFAANTFLLTLGVLLICELIDVSNTNTALTDLQEQSNEQVQRVDISHTYKEFEDGVYKIYPNYVSHMGLIDGQLYMEYIDTQMKVEQEVMVYMDKESSEISSTTSILHLPIHKKVNITVMDEVEEVDELITLWQDIKEKCSMDKTQISKYILHIKFENSVVTELSVEAFDVN